MGGGAADGSTVGSLSCPHSADDYFCERGLSAGTELFRYDDMALKTWDVDLHPNVQKTLVRYILVQPYRWNQSNARPKLI